MDRILLNFSERKGLWIQYQTILIIPRVSISCNCYNRALAALLVAMDTHDDDVKVTAAMRQRYLMTNTVVQ